MTRVDDARRRLAVLGDSIAWGQGASREADRLAPRLVERTAGYQDASNGHARHQTPPPGGNMTTSHARPDRAAVTGPHSAKHPRTLAAGPYGHPFHPILVTIPIGAWTAALVFDLVALLGSDESAFAEGAQWLVGIGIVGALAAAAVGLMDLGTIPRGTLAFRTAIAHMVLNTIALTLFAISFLLRWQDDELPISAFVLSLVAFGLLGASGWLGGKLSYTYGVRVADEQRQADGFS